MALFGLRVDNKTMESFRSKNRNEYNAIHQWVYKRLTKTGVCSHCGDSKKTDWSNKSGEYKRELDDWQELCHSCHLTYDIRVLGVAKSPKKLTPADLEIVRFLLDNTYLTATPIAKIFGVNRATINRVKFGRY